MIRQVVSEDWRRLREVRLRALSTDPDRFLEAYETAASRDDDVWRARATPDDTHAAFVVEGDGRFDGMVSCFIADDPGLVFLVAMWVAPDVRGTGVAGALVDRVVDWALERGARLVCLSVEPSNSRAARLYASRGFVETFDPPPFPYAPPPGERFFVYDLGRRDHRDLASPR